MITKEINGYCPENDDETSILVDFIEVSSLDSPTEKIKGRFKCNKNLYGQCKYCNEHGCPIYDNIPKQLK